ncbi:MAG TPA: LPS assembly protein LptD [Bryobacteraceae bacterium]|nr:LPS assembly protein LptD [Bryobacteraceae bacterium]
MIVFILVAGLLPAQTAETPVRPKAPSADEILAIGVTQTAKGPLRFLRGRAEIQTAEMRLRADEIDFNEEKQYAEARGNVSFDNFQGGEHVEADRAEYNLNEQTGKFFNVRGSSPARLEARPGVLTTTSPFSFWGKWAERVGNRYLLHEGFITNCKLPRPWWVLRGRTFEIVPGEQAIARNAVFRLRKAPLFYTPYFYKSLERAPRRSGFLQPSFGNSNRRGQMLGVGYYWAINRSYDATYRSQLFTQRGLAHHVDFRGKPAQQTDFNFTLYGVNDRGPKNREGGRDPSQGGFLSNFTGRSDLPHGFRARGQFNYLSSFIFRQAFTESFYEAIYSEVHSLGHVSKYWQTFGFNVVASRIETFQWPTPESFPSVSDSTNKLSLRKLPSVEFNSRDRQISDRVLPVWVSWTSSASLLRRHERNFTTAQFVDRLDIEPRITTALRWKDIHLIPAFSVRETRYGSSLDTERRLTGQSFLRSSREFTADLLLPSVSRVFDKPPRWIGKKFKHVVETRASFRHVGGVGLDFHRAIRFDETEMLSDTNEVDVTVTNRFYTKDAAGNVNESIAWDVTQRRFLDPGFGGALIPGERNVFLSSASLTGYAFLDAPRTYSPIISNLRVNLAGVGVDWRTDYDPARSRMVNSTLSMNGRRNGYFLSVGHNQARSAPVTSQGGQLRGLTPRANQLFTMLGFGEENRRGWSTGGMVIYDYTQAVMQYSQAQLTYNTDCCGWSFQYRRLGFRNENDFRFAFSVANIGSFGNLRRQERMF